MNCEEANAISIIGFLNSRGFKPVKITGNNYWYLSPIRNEKSPSLKVDAKLNRWFDHGIGQGGKLVDLGIRLLKLDVAEFLNSLSQNDLKSFSFQKPEVVETPVFEIKKIKPLENKALTSYLKERSISLSLAREYCQEIYYRINDKNYFAIGFKNDSNAYEIRNRYFKACLGSKDITTIQIPDSNKIILFEGFIDFLSGLKQLQLKMSQSSFIVLNSVNQLEKAKTKINEINPSRIEAYFDNDDAGRRCFADLQKEFPNAVDQSGLYKGHKDINEMISRKNNKANEISM
jgi:hypothetical protein